MPKHIGYTHDSSPSPPPSRHVTQPKEHLIKKGLRKPHKPLFSHAAMSQKTSSRPLTRASVLAAHEIIKPHIHRTPILTNTTLSTLASTPQTPEALENTQWAGQTPAKPTVRLFFKAENFQRIGAFKVRGAFHAVGRLIEELGVEEVRRRGVVTHSSGNVLLLERGRCV
jgi:threonine dehydratase